MRNAQIGESLTTLAVPDKRAAQRLRYIVSSPQISSISRRFVPGASSSAVADSTGGLALADGFTVHPDVCVAVGKEITVGTPKSKASTRTLPMPDDVVEVLRAARKRQAEERLAFGGGYGSGEYVGSDEFGQPHHPNLLTFRWGRMLDELGIKRVRLHDARHSCATLMHLRQVPIAVIAAWLGHASAAFTMSRYAHSQDQALKDAASSFGRLVTTRDTETGSEG